MTVSMCVLGIGTGATDDCESLCVLGIGTGCTKEQLVLLMANHFSSLEGVISEGIRYITRLFEP